MINNYKLETSTGFWLKLGDCTSKVYYGVGQSDVDIYKELVKNMLIRVNLKRGYRARREDADSKTQTE